MNARRAKLFNDLVLRIRGWDYRPALRDLERLQWASVDQVHEYQKLKLRSLLQHCARHVPFYRSGVLQTSLDSPDVDPIACLGKLPVVTKAMLREDYGQFLARDCARASDVWASSGSTGEPFRFRRDRKSIASNTFASLARGLRWWNVDFGVRSAMIWSGVRGIHGACSSAFLAARRRISWRLKNICLIDVYELDDRAIQRAYAQLSRFKPVFLRTISSGLYRFCSALDRLGMDGRELKLRCAIYTGESLLPSQKRLVERVLGCRAVCEYGCTELGILALECPQGGIHVNHENLFVEYLRDGLPAEPGKEAEIVVTDLDDYVAPLVRYAVGDLVVPALERCSCGRSLPVLSSVVGRSHDTIATPGGRAVHALYFTHLFDRLDSVHQFRVVQDRIETIRIELKSPQRIAPADVTYLRRAVEAIMGPGVEVHVVQVSDIPAEPSGKTPWIVSKVRSVN